MRSWLRSGPRAWLAVALGAALLVAGAYTAARITRGAWVEHSLAALIPGDSGDPATARAVAAFQHRLERKLVFLVAHADRAIARQAAGRLAAELGAWPPVTQVRGAVSAEQPRAWAQFYTPFRHQLLTPQARALLEQDQGHVLQQQALATLHSPFASVGARELVADPFLLLRGFLLEQAARGGIGQLDDSWPMRRDADGTWYVLVTAELSADPFGVEASQQIVSAFNAMEARLRVQFPGTRVLRQGALFYSAAASQQAETEVSIIGMGSALGVTLVNLWVFRSAIPLGLTLLSVGSGLLAGAAAALLFTGPLHIFTLVFGSTLIGVAEDYASHYLCHRADVRSHDDGETTLRRILPAMVMSLVTTLLAYLALLLAPFPVLRQLTVFSAVGLSVSFVLVVLWFPYLTRPLRPRLLPGGVAAEWWLTIWKSLHGWRLWIPMALLTACALPFALGQRGNDDIRALQSLAPELVRQEQRITTLFGLGGSTELFLVRGSDIEQLLQRTELAAARLDAGISAGTLEQHAALSTALPSLQRQGRDHALVRDRLYARRLAAHAKAIGLPRAAVEPVAAFRPMRPEDWLASPVSDGWRALLHDGGDDGLFAAIPLRNVRDPEALTRAAAEIPGVRYVNKVAEISAQFRDYRLRISLLLGAAASVTFGLLALRHGWRSALRIQLPTVAAAVAALAVLRILGMPVNLFTVLALIMVLGMGIDYTLFFAESHGGESTTQLAVTLAAVSTILAFGLLAFSGTAALANFGTVLFTGVLVSFLLAPMAMRHDG